MPHARRLPLRRHAHPDGVHPVSSTQAHDSHPIFTQVPTITIADGMKAVRFKLWDERSNKMVTFSQARRSRARTLTGAEAILAARPERQGAS